MDYKSYSQYSEPETWLSSAYPTIYAIWRRAISSKTTTTLNMELTCAICKVKSSSGQHYGVKMCEADKQFLKRSFHQRLLYPPCINAGSEAVCPPRPRGWCQICRLQTCLANPVNITMIRVGEKVKKSKKETRELSTDTTTNMSLFQNQQFPTSIHYSRPDVKDWVSTLYNASPTATYQYLHYPIPYDVPSTYQHHSSFSTSDIEAEKLLVESVDDFPLDLRTNKEQVDGDNDVDEWFHQEVAFTELHTQQSLSDHLFDVSTSYMFDSNSLTLLKQENLSGRESSILASSRFIANSTARTSASPEMESSHGVNKLSVNSTILGHALAQVQSSISMSSSLVNLSSVSDILTEADNIVGEQ